MVKNHTNSHQKQIVRPITDLESRLILQSKTDLTAVLASASYHASGPSKWNITIVYDNAGKLTLFILEQGQ